MSQTKKPFSKSADADTSQMPERIALLLTGIWLLGAVVFVVIYGVGGLVPEGSTALQFSMILVAIFIPVAVFWMVASLSKNTRVMRAESRRLQAAIDAIRSDYIQDAKTRANAPVDTATVSQKLSEIADAQRKTESALATFTSTRAPEPARVVKREEPSEDQSSLPLDGEDQNESAEIAHSDFIRALNFPETAEDRDGFAALRRALKDRKTAQLIQAAQDILTLLSHDGIYMDDLRPDIARPEIWRRFAAGERGRVIAALGGIRDRSSLALVNGRMKQDPIFRDAVHHFLRRYDQMISDFADTASDADMTDLSNTRTSRAFMLLGRVAGTFD